MTSNCSSCGNKLTEGNVRCDNCLRAYEPHLIEAINRYYDESTVVSNPDSETYRRRETFQEKVQLLLPRLEDLAAKGVYKNQSAVIGDGIDIWAMKHYLGAASAIEYWDGRPLLTSVIINESRGFPAEGYFRLVERLDGLPDDIMTWSESEKQEWWKGKLAEVHEHWEKYGNSA